MRWLGAMALALLAACTLPEPDQPCAMSQPVAFSIHGNQGTYTLLCDSQGAPDAVVIDWHDAANYAHHVTVSGDIFTAWVANDPMRAGSIEAAMDSGPSSIAGAPVLGMPFEDQVCRDAACTQIDQAFDQGWVFDDHHQLSFTQDYRDTLTYADVRAKSYHNTYAHNEPLWDLLTYYRLRSVEFDFHTQKDGNSGPYQEIDHDAPNGADWFVYHYQGFTSDDDSRCFRLSDCLKELKAWHDANPYHEVITVFGDAGINFTFAHIGLANNPAWDAGHRPLDFDDRIERDLAGLAPDGTPILFTPRRLVAWCSQKLGAAVGSLRDATQRCGWPTLKELRGHVIWVMTYKDGDPAYGVNTYLDPAQNGGHAPAEMAAFGIDEAPVGDPDNSGWDVVFFNYGSCGYDTQCTNEVTQTDRDHVRATHDGVAQAMRYITRLYSNDSARTFNLARRDSILDPPSHAPANFLATHHGTDPLLRTMPAPSRGYPFECIDGADRPPGMCNTANWIESSAPAIRLVGSSGSITSSSELARLEAVHVEPNTRWVWTTGVIGDRLDHPGVYGCLEARHSTAIADAFVAICRDNQSAEVTSGAATLFWRLTPDGPIQDHQLVIDDGRFPGYDGYGLEPQHTVFLKLSVFCDAQGVTHAIVYTSRDGVHWGCDAGNCDWTVDFPPAMKDSLGFQGISLSTSNQGSFEFLFLNTTVRSYSGATSRFDPPEDGVLTATRLVKAGDVLWSAGDGTFGDLGDGLGEF